MKNIYKITLLIIIVFKLSACEDIFEASLNSQQLQILSPKEGAELENTKIVFYWQPMESNPQYNVKIVAPEFSKIEKILCDTNLSTNNFEISLPNGDYQWMIYAFNNSSFSDTLIQNFSINDTSNVIL